MDLESIAIAAPYCKAAGLESPNTAIGEPRQEHHRIIHFPFGDKSVSHRHQLRDGAVEMKPEVNRVRQKISHSARTRLATLKAPA